MQSPVRRVVILGASGREFHDFNTLYRDKPDHHVVAFATTRAPAFDGRRYPSALAGSLYPGGIPIVPEDGLEELIRREMVDLCVFSRSDVAHGDVMHAAERAIAAGADFLLLGADRTMLKAKVPVVAVTSASASAGRSETTLYVARLLQEQGLRVVVVRNTMPAGNVATQAWKRYATPADLGSGVRSIEEREECDALLGDGFVVYAGVDYGKILKCAESEADVILWDGAKADLPFFVPDLHICVADPRRPGLETAYHPGEANFRRADVILVSTCDVADEGDVYAVEIVCAKLNPKARVICALLPVVGDRLVLREVAPGRLAEELARVVPVAAGAAR